jgi:hypothetical protein
VSLRGGGRMESNAPVTTFIVSKGKGRAGAWQNDSPKEVQPAEEESRRGWNDAQIAHTLLRPPSHRPQNLGVVDGENETNTDDKVESLNSLLKTYFGSGGNQKLSLFLFTT